LKVGILALQGDVREHARALDAAGATPVEVKRVSELAEVDGLVLPGGESTTIGKLLDRFELLEPLRRRTAEGLPVYGTCAGMILLADEVIGRDPAPHRIGGLDISIERNAYGRQVDSFEADLEVAGIEGAFRAVFIRAPAVDRVGDDVEVLANVGGRPVLVRQGNILASSFHPEMTGDDRIHRMFVELAGREA
jgi:5'-phosphate synthase pdxT subunit